VQFNCVKKLFENLNWMFSGTAQVSQQVCQFFCQFCVSSCACDSVQVTICTLRWTQESPLFYSFWKVECLAMIPSWCRQVNWGKCGILWVNCAVLCVKDDWKEQFWGLRHWLSKMRSLLSFSIRYDVTQENRSVWLSVYSALNWIPLISYA